MKHHEWIPVEEAMPSLNQEDGLNSGVWHSDGVLIWTDEEYWQWGFLQQGTDGLPPQWMACAIDSRQRTEPVRSAVTHWMIIDDPSA